MNDVSKKTHILETHGLHSAKRFSTAHAQVIDCSCFSIKRVRFDVLVVFVMQRLVDKIVNEFQQNSDYVEIGALDGNGGETWRTS